MKYPLAIVDYGIGGLGLYQVVRRNHPKLPILYFSDSGQVPYGKQTKPALRKRLEQVFRYLFEQGADLVVVACHSGSSVVSDQDDRVVGIRRASLAAMSKFKPSSVGVIGGGRTIKSRFYRNQLTAKGWDVSQRVAQPLSIFIERAEVDTPQVRQEVARIMKPLRKCRYILLACTHYPVLSLEIRRHVSDNARLVDPVHHLYRSIAPILRKHSTQRGQTKFLTTGGVVSMQRAAGAFGVFKIRPQKVTIPEALRS